MEKKRQIEKRKERQKKGEKERKKKETHIILEMVGRGKIAMDRAERHEF